ncbi:MAG: hypothetical protein J6B80_06315 [Clostridia bacterium]|nr:hypothetical protein [Clostridia bacterium]
MKSYEEIANTVFKRRDKYIANKKKKKRIIVSIFVPTVCCICLILGLGLWQNGFFNNIPVSKDPQNVLSGDTSNPTDNNTQNNNSVSQPSNSNSSQDSTEGDDVTSSTPSKNENSNPSEDTSSNESPTYPPVVEGNYFIDSIDKVNFYSAKKVIDENSFWPFSTGGNFAAPKVAPLSNIYVTYPIDRDKVFTTTMVTYFTINLYNEDGFLAQKLGGTGLVEVVVTENNINGVESIITFKRENRYYSCIMNGESHYTNSDIISRNFSSHKYINGFSVVKNLEQENYKFIVYYDGAKVVGFECASFDGVTEKYEVDEVKLVDDYCVVIYTKKTFTIAQLEAYFKKEAFGLNFKKNKSDYSKIMM